jgi:hypothetical protein
MRPPARGPALFVVPRHQAAASDSEVPLVLPSEPGVPSRLSDGKGVALWGPAQRGDGAGPAPASRGAPGLRTQQRGLRSTSLRGTGRRTKTPLPGVGALLGRLYSIAPNFV